MPEQSRKIILEDKPPGFLGSYHTAVQDISAAAAGANTPYFSFRWGHATALCVIRAVELRVMTNVATTTSPVLGFYLATGFTASDTGGTAVVPTKKRTAHGASLATDIRFGNSAALTPGTRVLDAQAFLVTTTSNTAQQHPPGGNFGQNNDDPIILSQNEGIVMNNVLAIGAGSHRFIVKMEWIELSAGSL